MLSGGCKGEKEGSEEDRECGGIVILGRVAREGLI